MTSDIIEAMSLVVSGGIAGRVFGSLIRLPVWKTLKSDAFRERIQNAIAFV
jgi:hypothetical protein